MCMFLNYLGCGIFHIISFLVVSNLLKINHIKTFLFLFIINLFLIMTNLFSFITYYIFSDKYDNSLHLAQA